MALELKNQIPFFLNTFLGRPNSALPKGAQWILTFDGQYIPDGSGPSSDNSIVPVTAIKAGIKYEPEVWDIDTAIANTTIPDYHSIKGCLFAQAVSIPGESNQVNPEGLQQSGLIRSVTGGGRDAFANLEISFLETNVSFVDNVIRPWVIATAHLGMIARSGDLNYRGNLSVYKLAVGLANEAPYISAQYKFYGICPISVSGEEYNYTQTTSPVNRNAVFTYHYYTINSPIQNNTTANANAISNSLPVNIREGDQITSGNNTESNRTVTYSTVQK
jgi:hypothetical protein